MPNPRAAPILNKVDEDRISNILDVCYSSLHNFGFSSSNVHIRQILDQIIYQMKYHHK